MLMHTRKQEQKESVNKSQKKRDRIQSPIKIGPLSVGTFQKTQRKPSLIIDHTSKKTL